GLALVKALLAAVCVAPDVRAQDDMEEAAAGADAPDARDAEDDAGAADEGVAADANAEGEASVGLSAALGGEADADANADANKKVADKDEEALPAEPAVEAPSAGNDAAHGIGVMRLPAGAYPEPRVRGIEGGSL